MSNTKKAGRPLIKDSLKREFTINLKVNTVEKEYIDTLLLESDFYNDRNSMLRDIVINENYTVRELKEDRFKLIELQKLKKELHGIGLNFNQTVKHINSKKLNYFTQEDKKQTASSLIKLNNSLEKIYSFLTKEETKI
jgi:hypothetical protein